MNQRKYFRSAWMWGLVFSPLWQIDAQCFQSPLFASAYEVGSCHGAQYQQAVGQVLTAYGQCGDLYFTSPLTEQDEMTSVGNTPANHQVLVYPNPVLDLMYIGSGHFDSGEVRVYSVLGSLLLHKQFTTFDDAYIDLTFLHAGGYVVKIILDDQKQSIHTIIKTN